MKAVRTKTAKWEVCLEKYQTKPLYKFEIYLHCYYNFRLVIMMSLLQFFLKTQVLTLVIL